MKNLKGYVWPDTINPGEDVCIRIYVPKDALYIGAFWQSYEFFGTWLAWQKDTAKTGKEIAAVWRPLIEKARIEFELNLDCGIMDVRQKTGFPCILEKQDGAGEWSEFADISLCQTTIISPYPDPPPGETGAEASSDDVVYVWIQIFTTIHEKIEDGDSWFNIKDWLTSVLSRVYPGKDVSDAAGALVEGMQDKTTGERADAIDNSAWEDLYNEVGCNCLFDGSFLDAAADAIFDWLNSASDWMFNLLSEMNDAIFSGINGLAGKGDALTRWAKEGKGGGGAGFGGLECDWTQVFDFTGASAQGWTLLAGISFWVPPVFGALVSGGWQSIPCFKASDPNQHSEKACIKISTGNSRILSIQTKVQMPDQDFEGIEIFIPPFGENIAPDDILASIYLASGLVTVSWTGNQVMNQIGINTGKVGNGPASYIEEVTISGTGANPFD